MPAENTTAASLEDVGATAATLFAGAAAHGARWLQLAVFYLPLVLAFAFNLVTYVRVGRSFSRMVRAAQWSDRHVPASLLALVTCVSPLGWCVRARSMRLPYLLRTRPASHTLADSSHRCGLALLAGGCAISVMRDSLV